MFFDHACTLFRTIPFVAIVCLSVISTCSRLHMPCVLMEPLGFWLRRSLCVKYVDTLSAPIPRNSGQGVDDARLGKYRHLTSTHESLFSLRNLSSSAQRQFSREFGAWLERCENRECVTYSRLQRECSHKTLCSESITPPSP